MRRRNWRGPPIDDAGPAQNAQPEMFRQTARSHGQTVALRIGAREKNTDCPEPSACGGLFACFWSMPVLPEADTCRQVSREWPVIVNLRTSAFTMLYAAPFDILKYSASSAKLSKGPH